jgi:hypothetical protein
MGKFAFVALITLVTSFASGQTKAPSMTVFGLELGKSFTIQECRPFKIAKRSFDYEGTEVQIRFFAIVDFTMTGNPDPPRPSPRGIEWGFGGIAELSRGSACYVVSNLRLSRNTLDSFGKNT